VQAAFHFQSGPSGWGNAPGWYVDDVAVTSDAFTNDWIAVAPTNLVVAPQCGATVTVTVTSAGIPTGDRAALLHALNNSPSTPAVDVPVYMKVRSPPLVQVVAAAQTSTNGTGWVTISNTVVDADGDVCSLEYLWSTNAGALWLTNVMVGAVAAVGSPSIAASGTPQIGQVSVTNGTNAVTNVVAAAWATAAGFAPLSLATNVLVRCRAWDGTFWSASATSQPFLVDNQPPSPPSMLVCSSHVPGVWSTNTAVALSWVPATDLGGGMAGYRCGLLGGVGIQAVTGQTTGTTVSLTTGADGTNWQAYVQAVDVYGNLGAPATLGNFWIDTTPPSAAGATVTVARSPDGDYVLNSVLSGSWSGFADAGSGIAGYYVALTNGQGTTNGLWTGGTSATVSGAVLDATNTVYIWARDTLGLIGPAASASVLVLSPDGDWDGDGVANAAEAVAGTDARNPASVLRLEPVRDANTGTVFAVRWPGATNRLYALAYRDGLWPTNGGWVDFDDATNLPGVAGFMTYTDRNAAVAPRFYRVSVEQPTQP